MERHFDQHISRQFNHELDALRKQMMAMGGLVEEMTKSALIAVLEGETALAQEVMRTDARVNELEKRIDQQCTLIIARRQPAASDLRLVFSISKTTSDLERIGDEACSIARLAIGLVAAGRERKGLVELEAMGQRALDMLKTALDGYARLSSAVALELLKQDTRMDAAYHALYQHSCELMVAKPQSVRHALNLLLVGKSLERIGDHCKNLGEYIVYLVEGRDLRHAPLTDFEALAR